MWSECSCTASSVVFACLLRDKWSRCEIANVFQVLTSTPTPTLLQAGGLPYTTVMVRISPTSILIFLLFANSWELFRLQRVNHNQTISGWLSFLVINWEVDFVDLLHSAWVFFYQILYCGFEVCLKGPREFEIFLCYCYYIMFNKLLY